MPLEPNEMGRRHAAGPAPARSLRGLLGSRTAHFGLVFGVAVFAAVIAWQGIGDVAQAFGRAGWWIVVIAFFHFPPMVADALGWRSLVARGHRLPRLMMLRIRWIGESINELLPVLQMGGNVVKAWLLTDFGIPVGRAAASVVVDVTLVVLSQILFTLFGLALLIPTVGNESPLFIIFAGAGVMAILLAGFYIVQRRGFFGLVVRISERILGGPEWTSVADGAAAIDTDVVLLYKERSALLRSGCWHILAWFLGVGEIWVALRLFGHPVDIATALLFESLGQAIRTGAFAVPGALGIQEGGYVLVGRVLGIEPGVALALSLARRVQEIIFGLPGLALWQAATIRQMIRRG